MWRALIIIHRYLGILAGTLMVMWFVSGIVMMYVGFPRVGQKLAGSNALNRLSQPRN